VLLARPQSISKGSRSISRYTRIAQIKIFLSPSVSNAIISFAPPQFHYPESHKCRKVLCNIYFAPRIFYKMKRRRDEKFCNQFDAGGEQVAYTASFQFANGGVMNENFICTKRPL